MQSGILRGTSQLAHEQGTLPTRLAMAYSADLACMAHLQEHVSHTCLAGVQLIACSADCSLKQKQRRLPKPGGPGLWA